MNEESLFHSALQKPPEQRAAFLDQACAGDAEVQRRVASLLEAHEPPDSFLLRPPIDGDLLSTRPALDGETPAAGTAGGSPGNVSLDFLQPSDEPDVLGRLGDYEVLSVIGRGGMGLVLKARDQRLNRTVAIKLLAPEFATSAAARKRFVREAQAAAAVSHDHVVTIHGVGETNGIPYLVMEYVAGESLQQRIDKQGQFDVKEVLRVGVQAAHGLAAAHRQGLVHRDVKPANILLENGVERVKITDFGLARAVDDVSITQTGVVAGTPQYMSPEQARGHSVDHRSDLFSLGCVLYTMCAGRPPFRGDSTVEVLRRICDERPQPIRELNPDVPRWLVDLIEQLLEKAPGKRFDSAEEVAGLFEGHLSYVQHPSTAAKPKPGRRQQQRARRRTYALAAAAFLLVFAAGFGATEGMGVSNVTTTIIRIAVGEGVLAIEVEDPSVSVTVEGDETISIRGAGLKEIRLRPGKYRFRASKNGRPLREELITIRRNDRTLVRVVREVEKEDTPVSQWISLFNGRDLTGWETHPEYPGGWTVENGILTGRTPPPARLFTTRNDFANFHLRVEARINEGQNSGVFFRAPFHLDYLDAGKHKFPIGYEAMISGKADGNIGQTGELRKDGRPLEQQREMLVQPGEWFTQEIIARGNHIVVKVNGRTTADCVDAVRTYAKGRIVLQAFRANAVAEFRTIEILKLPDSPPQVIKSDAAQVARSDDSLTELENRLRDRTGQELENAQIHFQLGNVLARQAKWQPAAEAYARGLELDPSDYWQWYRSAALQVEVGNVDEYHSHGREMLLRFDKAEVLLPLSSTEKAGLQERLAKTLVLVDPSEDDVPAAENLIDAALVDAAPNKHLTAWCHLTKALVEYRAGRAKEAVRWIEDMKIVNSPDQPRREAVGQVVLALAWHALGDRQAAQDALATAHRIMLNDMPEPSLTPFVDSGEWHEWLHAQILIREAEQALGIPPANMDKFWADTEGWTPLFNGRNLSGWKTHPDQPGNWMVEDGLLVGRSVPPSHLFTVRDNFKDFHLRIETKIDSGDSGVKFRCPFGLDIRVPAGPSVAGYDAQITTPVQGKARTQTGTLFKDANPLAFVSPCLVPPGNWFTFEIIARGNQFTVKVNGLTTAEYMDDDSDEPFTIGHIALQAAYANAKVQFRRIEIKELPPVVEPPAD